MATQVAVTAMARTTLRRAVKPFVVRHFLAYDADGFVRALGRLGVVTGDTLMVHASWAADNGFRGKPAEMIGALRRALGEDGLLAMTSMPYHNRSSAEYLAAGRAFDVRRSPSQMGLLTEVFRRTRGVLRSASPTHPVLALGPGAAEFLAGHESVLAPFGPGTPFARLLERDGKVLTIDAPFSTITFTHFLEDRIKDSLPFSLYEDEPMTATVIDAEGRERRLPVLVLSRLANQRRREARLIAALEERRAIRRARIGNTRLMLIACREMTACVDAMRARGESFFDTA